jgi:hypothetical protein
VKKYRIYSLDESGRISGEREIEAENDQDAIFSARSMQRPLITEVWDRDMRVARIPAFTPRPDQAIHL